MKKLINKLEKNRTLTAGEFKELLITDDNYLHTRAAEVRADVFGNEIFMRGLVEFTSYCKNDCYYCGLRKSNTNASRYRYTLEQIIECCDLGYELGFRTFVLQGGEDPFFTDEKMIEIIQAIKNKFPDCALTLSLGEKSRDSLQKYRNAGADRYLLRHETANDEHYSILHPPEMTLNNRKQCLFDLKELGYQVGCGIMVGSPGQTLDHIVDDLFFIKELDPAMVGVGPFIPHSATPFANEKQGGINLTLNLIAILRLLKPNLLIPSTTALGTVDPKGREMGVLAGANIVMPNLSPPHIREQYLLYDNKICTGDGPMHCRVCIGNRMKKIGCEIVVKRGDYSEISCAD